MNVEQTMGEQMEERSFHTGGVTGSIPVAPTIQVTENTQVAPPDEGVILSSQELRQIKRSVHRFVELFKRASQNGLPRPARMLDKAVPWLTANYLDGEIKVTWESVPSRIWAEALAFGTRHSGSRGEGIEHVAGKRALRNLLWERAGSEPVYEADAGAGRSDVYSAAARVIVEVGVTRIDKVMECAAAETVCDFWLVPFRWDERPPKIVKFAFTDAAREDAKATIREFYADERNWRYL